MHYSSIISGSPLISGFIPLALLTSLAVTMWLWTRRTSFLLVNVWPKPDLQLGCIRAIVCCIALFIVVRDDPRQTLLLPIELIQPRTFLYEVVGPFWRELIRSPLYLGSVWWIAVVALSTGALGLATRFSLIIGGVSFLLHYDLLSSYTHLFHSGLLPLQLLLLLTFLPSGHRFSIDGILCSHRLSNSATNGVQSSCAYGVYLCWIVYAAAYFQAGISKLLAGISWFSPHTVLGYAVSDSLSLIEYDWNITLPLARYIPDWSITAGAILAVAIECGAILILVHRKASLALPVLIFILHLGIFAVHEFPFFDLLLLPLIFLPIGCILSGKPEPQLHPTNSTKRISWPITCAILFAVLLSPRLTGITAFPILDIWGMYAEPNRSDHVIYHKVYEVTRDGSITRTDFRDLLSMFREARWQDILRTDSSSQLEHLRRVVANFTRVRPSLVAIRIERWRWSFASDRLYGTEGILEQTWQIDPEPL